ncbi:MAG: hypothetical protein NC337_13335 [Roseburia sp.]|nr:hypothetical protein [Roseburia sp.]
MPKNTRPEENRDLNDRRTQWHMAFPAAMKLELMEYSGILEYCPEYLLNTKALQADLLIIKKEAGAVIENEIGRIFKGHNIIEYKSPHDREDVNTYFKVYAYASLYKLGKDGQSYDVEDITVTIIREGKPAKLFEWFGQHGCSVEQAYEGVYYIGGAGFFATQVVVARELDGDGHIWLKALTDSIGRNQARQLINRSRELLDRPEAEYADAVLQIASKANLEVFDRMKEEEADMYSALVELMRPEIDEAASKAAREAKARDRIEAIEIAMKKLNVSKKEACAFMNTTEEQYEEYKRLIEGA